jgi:hypothetical protein
MGSPEADSVQVFLFIDGLNPKIPGNTSFLAFRVCFERMFSITTPREL